jgi:hypothetical protein
LPAAFTIAVIVPAQSAFAGSREKQVLVLHSTRRTSQLVTISDREIPRILHDAFAEGVDYYTEFVEPSQFPFSQYEQAFRDFLLTKYRGQRFDIIIAMGDNALRFVDDTRRDLFPKRPWCFFQRPYPSSSAELDRHRCPAEPCRFARAGADLAARRPTSVCRQRDGRFK